MSQASTPESGHPTTDTSRLSRYVLQVLKSYIKPRQWRPRARADLERELQVLAALFPEFAPEFRAIHKAYRLPLPLSALPRETTVPRRPTTLYCGFHYLDRAPVVRVQSPTADPPPPYASEDPDPESTQLLALRLATEEDGDPEGEMGEDESAFHTAEQDVSDPTERERAPTALSFHSLSFELDTALHPAFRYLLELGAEDAGDVDSLDTTTTLISEADSDSDEDEDSDFDEPSDVECCSIYATEDAD